MAIKKKLLDGLNQDLAAEWGTVIRYTCQAARLYGVEAAAVRAMLLSEARDELGHAAYLSEIITDLGGDPVVTPKPFEQADDLRAMLDLDIRMEEQDVLDYMKHAAIAEDLGLVDVRMALEEMAADEARHARELRRLVGGV